MHPSEITMQTIDFSHITRKRKIITGTLWYFIDTLKLRQLPKSNNFQSNDV